MGLELLQPESDGLQPNSNYLVMLMFLDCPNEGEGCLRSRLTALVLRRQRCQITWPSPATRGHS